MLNGFKTLGNNSIKGMQIQLNHGYMSVKMVEK